MKLLCNEFCSLVVLDAGVVTAFQGNEIEVSETDATALLETGKFTQLTPAELSTSVVEEKEIPQPIARAGKSKKKIAGDENG